MYYSVLVKVHQRVCHTMDNVNTLLPAEHFSLALWQMGNVEKQRQRRDRVGAWEGAGERVGGEVRGIRNAAVPKKCTNQCYQFLWGV